MQEDFVRVSHLRDEEISQMFPRTGQQDRLGYTIPKNMLPKGRGREQAHHKIRGQGGLGGG